MFQSLFYWITYSYEMEWTKSRRSPHAVSILILLDYLFLYDFIEISETKIGEGFQSLFYWITYSYYIEVAW